MSLGCFVSFYEKHQRKVHRERKIGWKYPGYSHGLDTVWELSFQSLDSDGKILLGVLCFLVPDAIPLMLLDLSGHDTNDETLAFLENEFR